MESDQLGKGGRDGWEMIKSLLEKASRGSAIRFFHGCFGQQRGPGWPAGVAGSLFVRIIWKLRKSKGGFPFLLLMAIGKEWAEKVWTRVSICVRAAASELFSFLCELAVTAVDSFFTTNYKFVLCVL
jgi:hypothetical protein